MYKIIQKDKVVDVVQYPRFVSFLKSGHIAVTDKTSAQGIVGSDNKTIYSFKAPSKYPVVVIKEITFEELKRLQGLLSSNVEISADESALATAKREKIKRLSSICKSKITSGFTVKLANGEESFKLTTEDQLNLLQIENLLAAGETSFIYHATDRPCKIYTKADMTIVLKAFRKHVLYHTTYYNAVKQYINSLADIEKVNLFSYGMNVSEVIDDPVLEQILRLGGS
jgi:hypothetical protein